MMAKIVTMTNWLSSTVAMALKVFALVNIVDIFTNIKYKLMNNLSK